MLKTSFFSPQTDCCPASLLTPGNAGKTDTTNPRGNISTQNLRDLTRHQTKTSQSPEDKSKQTINQTNKKQKTRGRNPQNIHTTEANLKISI